MGSDRSHRGRQDQGTSEPFGYEIEDWNSVAFCILIQPGLMSVYKCTLFYISFMWLVQVCRLQCHEAEKERRWRFSLAHLISRRQSGSENTTQNTCCLMMGTRNTWNTTATSEYCIANTIYATVWYTKNVGSIKWCFWKKPVMSTSVALIWSIIQ